MLSKKVNYGKIFYLALIIMMLCSLQTSVFAETGSDIVSNGTASPYTSMVMNDRMEIAGDGKSEVEFTVYLYDATYNIVKEPTMVYMVSNKTTDVFETAKQSDGSGKVIFHLKSNEAGTSQITIGLNSELLTNPNAIGKIKTVDIVVKKSDVASGIKSLMVAWNTLEIVGDGKSTAKFVVQVRDENNNPVRIPTKVYFASSQPTDQFVSTSGSIVNGGGGSPSYIESDYAGMVSVDVKSTVPGTSKVSFALTSDVTSNTNGTAQSASLTVKPVANIPIVNGDASPYTSLVTYNESALKADCKSSAQITVQLYDANNNPIQRATDVYFYSNRSTDLFFKVTGVGELVAPSVDKPGFLKTDETGKMILEMKSSDVGTSIIMVGLKSDIVTNTNSIGKIRSFTLDVKPAVQVEIDPYLSTVTSNSNQIIADGKSSARYTVQLYDSNQNSIKQQTPVYLLSTQQDDEFIVISGSSELIPATSGKAAYIMSDESGKVVFEVSSSVPGMRKISIGIKEDLLSNPNSVGKLTSKDLLVKEVLIQGEANPEYSTATASSKQIRINGKSVVEYTIYLYDDQMNPITTPTDVYFTTTRKTNDIFTKIVGTGKLEKAKGNVAAHLKSDETGKLIIRVTSNKTGVSHISFGLDPNLMKMGVNSEGFIDQFKLKIVK